MLYQLTSASATHIGLLSSNNEDHYSCDDNAKLWVVADGMGGHAAGEVASKLAIDAVTKSFHNGLGLSKALADAHPVVVTAMQDDPSLAGMGTTLVAAHLKKNQYQIAWVGDSRCYHWSKQTLRQITRDHSYFQALLDSGEVDVDTARQHPEHKSLVQAIGVSLDMKPKVSIADGVLNSNEYLLLCSDGLTDEVDDNQIADIFAKNNNPQEICKQLINAALHNGGRDNITVIIIKSTNIKPEIIHKNSISKWLISASLLLSAVLLWVVLN